MDSATMYQSIRQIENNPRYPFTIGQIKHFLLNRHKNGLQMAVRKIGKRLYLRQDLFEQWIETQGKQGGKA